MKSNSGTSRPRRRRRGKPNPYSNVGQLSKVDHYICDLAIGIPDSADAALDMFNYLVGTDNYQTLIPAYGEFLLESIAVEIKGIPLLSSSSVTDLAVGAFAFNEGSYFTSIGIPDVHAVWNMLGSCGISNRDGVFKPWFKHIPMLKPKWYPSSITSNSADNIAPKATVFFAWLSAATTNVNLGEVHFRFMVAARCKKQ